MDLYEVCCQSKAIWDDLVKTVDMALLVIDSGGRIVFSGTTSDTITGYTEQEITGKELSILFTPEDMDCLYPNLLYLARTRRSYDGEIMIARADGSKFIARSHLQPCSEPIGGLEVSVFTIRDIDRRKKLEKVCHDFYYQDLVKIAEGIAHEIRNPLVGIGGFVNRLVSLQDPNPGDRELYRDIILGNITRIDNLIKKVEYFARLPRPHLRDVSLPEFTREALLPFVQPMQDRGITMKMDIEDVPLTADDDQLGRSIAILVENALEALPAGGEIIVRAAVEGGLCSISVSDNGRGIDEKDLPFIFNPFFSTKSDGAGIDLAIVRRIVDSHGGTVSADSVLGKGTTFTIQVPVERRRRIRLQLLEEIEAGKAVDSETAPIQIATGG